MRAIFRSKRGKRLPGDYIEISGSESGRSVKKKLKKVTEYTACFAFLMFLQGVGAPMVFADATAAINAKFEILWNLISAVVQSVGGVILLWHAFEFGASMQAQEGGGAITRSLKGVGGALVMLVAPVITTALKG